MSSRTIFGIRIATLLALGACAGGSKPYDVGRAPAERKAVTPTAGVAVPLATEFSAMPCPSATERTGSAADLALRATDLRLSQRVDYLAIREARHDERRSLGARGAPCSGASDRERCLQMVAALEAQIPAPPKQQCLAQDCMGTVYVVTTQGDRAALYRNADEVRPLLGPIDGPREAWLIAYLTLGASVYTCDEVELSAYRRVSEGYELRERVYTRACNPVEKTELVYRVDDVSQRVVQRKILSRDPWCMEGAQRERPQ